MENKPPSILWIEHSGQWYRYHFVDTRRLHGAGYADCYYASHETNQRFYLGAMDVLYAQGRVSHNEPMKLAA